MARDSKPDEDEPPCEVVTDHPVPEYWMEADEVEGQEFAYSTRHPEDWISSGPLGDGLGSGRRFPSWEEAERWARRFFGKRFKGRVAAASEGPRWAFLIRGPRG